MMPNGVASCFRGVSTKSGIGKTPPESLVSSTYVAKMGVQCHIITVTWTKSALSITIGDATCKVDLRPWHFWRKQGWRRLHLDGACHVDVFWDLGSATFASTSEPTDTYFVAVVWDQEAVLVVGDMVEEAHRRSRSKAPLTEAVLVSKKEHLFGDTCFATTARFGLSGRSHEVGIECLTEGPTDQALFISVDREPVIEVKRLVWKFRGNDTIYVEGLPVEIFWDVHDWLFSPPGLGHAVFVFKPGGECLQDKALLKSVSVKDVKWRIPSEFYLMVYAWKSD